MKVYFINLDRSAERRAWFMAQGEALGLDLVRIPAVDGRELAAHELDGWRSLTEDKAFLSSAEIGCFLSHRKAWEAVCAGDEKWAFIAEDDIHFSRNAAAFLADDSWIPEHATLIKAETDLRCHEFFANSWSAPAGRELRQLKSTHLGAGGYFLTREAAAHMLTFTEGKCGAVDGFLFAMNQASKHQLEVWQIVPAFCIQDVYVDEHIHTSVLKSVIDKERIESRLIQKNMNNDIYKILKREFKRIALQAYSKIIKYYRIITQKSVYKKISFEEI